MIALLRDGHDMETLSALLALCEGNPLVTGGFPTNDQWSRILIFLCRQLDKAVEQTVEWLVIWDAMMPMWHHCNDFESAHKRWSGGDPVM